MSEPQYPKCVNCTQPDLYRGKYGGYCLDCDNAGVPEKDAELARLRAENERLRDTRVGTHCEWCWDFGRSHYECARARVVALEAENERLKAALRTIQQWDCLNSPQADLCADLPWLRQVVDAALAGEGPKT